MFKEKLLTRVSLLTLILFICSITTFEFNFAERETKEEEILKKAELMISEKDILAAEAELKNFIKESTFNAEVFQKEKVAKAHYLLAKIYFITRRDSDCEIHLMKTFEIHPNFNIEESNLDFREQTARVKGAMGKDILWKAEKMIAEGDYDIAVGELNKFIEKREANDFRIDQEEKIAKAHYLLAKIYFFAENIRQCKLHIKLAFRIHPGFSIDEPNPVFREMIAKFKYMYDTTNVIATQGIKKLKKFPLILMVASTFVASCIIFIAIKKIKKCTLTVIIGNGIVGNPSSGSYEYKKGTSVNYSYRLESCNTQFKLKVLLDGNIVSSSGSFAMDKAHTLIAEAKIGDLIQ